ncbi:MAG: hypothetical protein K0S07_1054 [Chlamydiales bacterium]|jgi:hypothetical protein|nr:hypothetical protein [Chlamydiales bacterium]
MICQQNSYLGRLTNFLVQLTAAQYLTANEYALWRLRKGSLSHFQNQEVTLFFTSISDHNQALQYGLPNIEKMQKHTNLVFKEIGSIQDIAQTIFQLKQQNISIRNLWLATHGSKDSLSLNTQPQISYSTASPDNHHLLLKRSLEQLTPDATIIVSGCSTGHIDIEGATSIAQKIASLAPGRTVIAPTQNSCSKGHVVQWQEGKLSVKFTQPNLSYPQRKDLIGRIRDRFYFLLWGISDGRYGEDITARFKAMPQE